MKTRARLEEGQWVIDGSKAFITNSGISVTTVVGVAAVTGSSPDGKLEISAVLVPPGTPGFSVAPKYSKVGWACSDTHELAFAGCRVPEANLLGQRGRGYAQFLRTLDEGRVAIAALGTGLAQGRVDESVAYVRERTAFGGPIARFQSSQFKIADMEVRASIAPPLVPRGREDGRGRAFKKETAVAKLTASNAAMENARDATQVFGGYVS